MTMFDDVPKLRKRLQSVGSILTELHIEIEMVRDGRDYDECYKLEQWHQLETETFDKFESLLREASAEWDKFMEGRSKPVKGQSKGA